MLQKIMNRSKENKNDVAQVDTTDRIIYILTEKNEESLKSYLSTIGMNVKNIYKNIEDVKIAMLMEDKPTKLIVIESGKGRFTHSAAKSNLYDLLGICDAGNKLITVYYTRLALKTDYKNKNNNKKIKWVKYTNTGDVIDSVILKGNIRLHASEIAEEKVGLSTGTILERLNFVGDIVADGI